MRSFLSAFITATLSLVVHVAPTVAMRATFIDAGAHTTCAIVEGGEVWCWGSNVNGVLGAGLDPAGVALSVVPVPVVDGEGRRLRDMRQVSVGKAAPSQDGRSACAVSGSGRVWCWGADGQGQLGDGSMGGHRDHAAPVRAQGNASDWASAVQVAVGHRHACAITANWGEVFCWGNQTVNGYHAGRSNPTMVRGVTGTGASYLTRIDQIVAGARFTCALRSSHGRVACWGFNNESQFGQHAHTDIGSTWEPLWVLDPDGAIYPRATALVAGEAHACAIEAGGRLACWGRNAVGPGWIGATSGSGTTSATLPGPDPARLAATAIGAPMGEVRIAAAGSYHTCLRNRDLGNTGVLVDNVYCTGANSNGQIGNGGASGGATALLKQVPQAPSGSGVPTRFSDVVQLAAGARHTCALDLLGRVRCWGSNYWAQLGRGTVTGEYEAEPWPTPSTANVVGLDGTPSDAIFADSLEGWPW